jgi:hypothetical protein
MTTSFPHKKTQYETWSDALYEMGRINDFDIVTTSDILLVTKEEVVVQVTVATKIGERDIQVITKQGRSHLHPDDTFDAEIGIRLATSRALESAAKTLKRQGQGRVDHADYTNKVKALARQKSFISLPAKKTKSKSKGYMFKRIVKKVSING